MEEVLVGETDAVLQFRPVGPAEGSRLGDVKELARGAVRFGRVPEYLAIVADNPGDKRRQFLDRYLLASAGVDRLVAGIVVHQEHAEVGEVVHIEELPQRRAVTPACHGRGAGHFGLVEAPDKRRKHMGVGRMIVVVGAVEVRGHHRDVVRAVLTVQELAVLQAGYLGQGVRLVGLLQWAGQEAGLPHRLRGHAGVYA